MTEAEQKNKVLEYLRGKNMGQWSAEEEIEKDLSEDINHVAIRKLLPELVREKYLEFSRNGCSYKITAEGRRFSTNGGYK